MQAIGLKGAAAAIVMTESKATCRLPLSSAQPNSSNASIWKVLPTARKKACLVGRGVGLIESGTLITRTQSPTLTLRPATSVDAWRVGVRLRNMHYVSIRDRSQFNPEFDRRALFARRHETHGQFVRAALV